MAKLALMYDPAKLQDVISAAAKPPKQALARCVHDFESYSELDLKKVGAWTYWEHPSTEVICMSYKFVYPDGKTSETKLWWFNGKDCSDFPQEVLDHIAAGGMMEAHSAGFERSGWRHWLCKKFGFKMPRRWLDTQAVCAYRALPQRLEEVGKVLDLKHKKNPRGKFLLNKLAKPQKPNKQHKEWWRCRDEKLLQELGVYCIEDTESEYELSQRVGDLPLGEYKLWCLDQRINDRGVFVDLPAVISAQKIVAQVETKLTKELQIITGDAEMTHTKLDGIHVFMASQGFSLPSLEANVIDEALGDAPSIYHLKPMSPAVRRVLEIRRALARASAKKLTAYAVSTSRVDGRGHGWLQYHGAGTGRWAGRLVQPQNFPRGTTKVMGKNGKLTSPNMDLMIEMIRAENAELLELAFGDVMDVIASSLRGMIIAEPGKVFYVSDFSSIEARVTMWLAGQMEAMQIFEKADRKEGPDIYCHMAESIYHRPINKNDNPDERQLGKVGILGCFDAGTLVLTDRGWKAILEVTTEDQVWDGQAWVRHDGLLDQGVQKAITVAGVTATPDHKVLVGEQWVSILEAAQNASVLSRALARGSENLPSQVTPSTQPVASNTFWSSAHAALRIILSGFTTFSKEKVHGVTPAPRSKQDTGGRSISDTLTSWMTTTIESVCSIVSQLVFSDATIQKTVTSNTMADGVSLSPPHGDKIAERFFGTSPLSKDGIIQFWNWIARITTKDTSRETCSLSLARSMQETNVRSASYKNASQNLRRVYDLANAGPRNRFAILSDRGPLIVHNCGYQMSGERLQEQAKDDYGIIISLEEANAIVKAYRETYEQVPLLWRGLESAAVAAVVTGKKHYYSCVSYEVVNDAAGKWLTCILPNGRRIWYFNPQVEEIEIVRRDGSIWIKKQLSYEGRNNKKGGRWDTVVTYGGMLTENVVQAISRDLMCEAMERVEALGYIIILTVHDEIVAEVLVDFGNLKEYERSMSMCPPWAKGCPINVEGWRGFRYRKG